MSDASRYLLTAHHDSHHLSLVDAETLNIVERFDMPGRTAVLGVSGSGRYGFAIHRDDHCVTIIDGVTASVLATAQTEEQPTHFHAYENQVVIFNDGSGSVSIFDENALDQPPRVVKATQPDHGSAVVVEDYLLAGHLRLGRVDVYPIGQTKITQSFDCCPVLHGAAQIDSTGLFGCSDGVLLLKKTGDTFTSVKLDNPADAPPRTRVGLFSTYPQKRLALGNFGHGLVLIDPDNETMTVLTLPDHPLKFSFDPNSETILALTADGHLNRISFGGDLLASTQVVPAVEPPKGPDGKPRPAMAIIGNYAYVTAPDENLLVEIDLLTMEVQRQLLLGDQPSMLVGLSNKD